MITYENLFMAYEAALRSALLERVDGDQSLLPPTPKDLREAEVEGAVVTVDFYGEVEAQIAVGVGVTT